MNGLTTEQAKELLKKYGYNEIESKRSKTAIKIFIDQFKSPIILLLIFTAFVSLAINIYKNESILDSILIIIIVIFSSIFGFIQEYKAEKTLESLRSLTSPKAKVLRDGKWQTIDAKYLVPGDVIRLIDGDIIPADCKIIEGNLQINESILTGESKNIEKTKGNYVFSGTYVYAGNAICKVIKTGFNTEIGKIAYKTIEINDENPFAKQMKKFTNKIVFFSIILIIFIFFISVFKFGFFESLLLSVSLAVAAIPEDLPAIITITLSIGAKEMAKKNALIRRLSAIETIGRVNIICTDKTGTLTKGELEVKEIYTKTNNEQLIYDICFNCNNSKKIDNKWVGDETDVALKKFSLSKAKEYKKIKEIPFDSKRKMHTVVVDEGLVFVKGAPEVILDKCKYILIKNKKQNIEKYKKEILDKNKEFCKKGFRVIGLAYKTIDQKTLEEDLTFIGLISFYDPPREGVKDVITACKEAGIKVIIITGDNPITAKTIGKMVGIETKEVITGKDIDKMSENEILKKIEDGCLIFARVDPFHKLKILEALKKKNYIVAMTGDGVNDSLALKKADVGISMGIRGTEVAKQASDIILLDDNFVTIVEAIKQGKTIFKNIKKFTSYLLSCNFAEIIVVTFSAIFLPYIVLYPVQLLWLNLVTDGLPALAFAFDPMTKNILREKQEKEILDKNLVKSIFFIGIVMSTCLISLFLLMRNLRGYDISIATLLTGFILFEFVRIYTIEINYGFNYFFENRFLVGSIVLSIILHVLIMYSPYHTYLKLVPLSLIDWLIILLFVFIGFLMISSQNKFNSNSG